MEVQRLHESGGEHQHDPKLRLPPELQPHHDGDRQHHEQDVCGGIVHRGEEVVERGSIHALVVYFRVADPAT